MSDSRRIKSSSVHQNNANAEEMEVQQRIDLRRGLAAYNLRTPAFALSSNPEHNESHEQTKVSRCFMPRLIDQYEQQTDAKNY